MKYISMAAIDKIEDARRKNNIHWMGLVRLAVKHAPRETKKLMKKIEKNDRKVNELWRCLSDKLPD